MRIGGIKMENEVSYGVYSTQSRKFCFGIKEPSKTKARKSYLNELVQMRTNGVLKLEKLKESRWKNEICTNG